MRDVVVRGSEVGERCSGKGSEVGERCSGKGREVGERCNSKGAGGDVVVRGEREM